MTEKKLLKRIVIDPKIMLGKPVIKGTLPQFRILLKVVLPLRTFDIENTIELGRWIQKKNHLAFLSHRKKRLKVRAL